MQILMSSERALYLELRCRAAAALPPQPQKASLVAAMMIEMRMNLGTSPKRVNRNQTVNKHAGDVAVVQPSSAVSSLPPAAYRTRPPKLPAWPTSLT
jgi:hypothetical protein